MKFYSTNNQLHTFDIKIDQTRIRIYVSSKELLDWVYPAFAWQAHTSSLNPDIEIFALEGDIEGELRWKFSDVIAGDRISRAETGLVRTTFDEGQGLLNVYDTSTHRGLFWTQSANTLPEWEFGAPLRNILTWALAECGVHVIHSAGIGIDGSGVLLSGLGGAGKSTTTAMCVHNGFSTTGDDYCAISVGTAPRMYGIYGFLKLIPGRIGTENFSDVPVLKHRSDGKVHFDIAGHMVRSMTLQSIIFTRVSHEAQLSDVLPSKEVLLRLLASTLSQSLYPQKELLHDLSSLATTIRAFELELGNDTEKIQHIVRTACSR